MMTDYNDNTPERFTVGRTLPNAPYATTTTELATAPRRSKKLLKRSAIIVVLLALLAGIYGFRLWQGASGVLSGGNLLSALASTEPLARDSHGRTNVVIFGNSEDDPGHDGAQLADSIMVLSVDQDTHAANVISIPRDLYVKYNTTCSLGTSGKINAAYVCALKANDNNVAAASEAFSGQVGSVLGLDIQYYVKVDYTVLKQTVDALGGVTVTISSTDERGIYDVATGLELTNGQHTIDGNTALQLARARGSKGGYGYNQSNFNREQNQQALLRAILDKASSAGTLSNPLKVLSVVDSLGDNIKTNLTTAQLRSAIKVAQNLQGSSIVTLPLNDSKNPLVTTGTYAGQSIVRPTAGLYDYSAIQAYIKQAVTPTTSD